MIREDLLDTHDTSIRDRSAPSLRAKSYSDAPGFRVRRLADEKYERGRSVNSQLAGRYGARRTRRGVFGASMPPP